jgi:hypothetical protein
VGLTKDKVGKIRKFSRTTRYAAAVTIETHSFRVYFSHLLHSFRVYFSHLLHSFRVFFFQGGNSVPKLVDLLVSNSESTVEWIKNEIALDLPLKTILGGEIMC